RGRDPLVEGGEPLGVAGARGQGYVHGRLRLLVRPAAPGEDAALVQGRVEDGVVRPEDVLRAVAVVDVEVDDRDARGVARGLHGPGGDRDVVQQAEAEGGDRRRVVTGRADERERAPAGGVDRAPGGEQRRLVARLRGDRVRLEVHGPLDRAQQLEYARRVAADDVVLAGRPALRVVRERRQQHLQPLGRLRVPERRVQLGEGAVADELHLPRG